MSGRKRKDHRTIIHFDYDCFYASVFEHENPALKSLPLAVQQKQIIVTCNYEARRRGLRKLQLITEAKQLVPDVIIVLGEELGRFRDASKSLYSFLASFTWSGKVERLGFDEVFMDVSDIVDYNAALLNPNDAENSFFQMNSKDPTDGFGFNATAIAGHTYPEGPSRLDFRDKLCSQLILGSHLAQHLRWRLDEEMGYTCTVGISTNKLLSKLVGNLNKPKGQTTLIPPYVTNEDSLNAASNNVLRFLDHHDIGKIPGIGFKSSQKIRDHVLARPAQFEQGLIYGGTKESVNVYDVRTFSGMNDELLERVLGGPGAEKGIGGKIWGLVHGVDEVEVKEIRKVPSQISIEDSYIRLDTMPQVIEELHMLATSLIRRMHVDLLDDVGNDETIMNSSVKQKRWVAVPRTIRLSTRPRPPLNADGTRLRTFNRISNSGRLPRFAFNLKESITTIAARLVQEVLIPMFKRLHPQLNGWNLSLVNICVTGLVETASEDAAGEGRNIEEMFRKQDDVLKHWKVEDRDVAPDALAEQFVPNDSPDTVDESNISQAAEPSAGDEAARLGLNDSEDVLLPTQVQNSREDQAVWENEDDDEDTRRDQCHICGAVMPAFAMAAHERYHDLTDG